MSLYGVLCELIKVDHSSHILRALGVHKKNVHNGGNLGCVCVCARTHTRSSHVVMEMKFFHSDVLTYDHFISSHFYV
jgi:hypothetical protein